MTLITAITSDVGRSIEMRADRLAAQGNGLQREMGTAKIWQTPHAIVGVAGSLRVAQIIRSRVGIPAPDSSGSVCGDGIVTAVRDALSDLGALTDSENGLACMGGYSRVLVAASSGQIITVDSDFSWDQHSAWAAIGSGADHFEGAYTVSGNEEASWRAAQDFVAIGPPADRLSITVVP